MVSVQHIKKSFGTHLVLRDVSFEVPDGSIYGLIGKNGAGKTTLMNIVAGLSTADSGNCVLTGAAGKSRCSIGFLPDVPSFFDYLTAGEYLRYLSMQTGKGYASSSALINLVHLKPDIKIGTMSRGMRQRLGIAAVLVRDPAVLLLDEPASALDPSGRYEVMEILRDLRRRNKTIILSTHILADMEHLCDAVGFLHGGYIKKSLSLNQHTGDGLKLEIVFQNPYRHHPAGDVRFTLERINSRTIQVHFTEPSLAAQREVLRFLAALDNPICSIRNIGVDLESIFQEVCV